MCALDALKIGKSDKPPHRTALWCCSFVYNFLAIPYALFVTIAGVKLCCKYHSDLIKVVDFRR